MTGPEPPEEPLEGSLEGPAEKAIDAAVEEPIFSRSDLRDLARAVAVSLLLGLPAGLVWLWVAPRVELVVSGHQVDFASAEPTGFMSADIWFFAVAAGFGVLAALVVRLLLRRQGRTGGLGAVVGLVVGCLAGAGVMALVGGLLGHADPFAAAAHLSDGAHLQAALKLRSYVAVVGWPLGALGLWLALDARRVLGELLAPVEVDDGDEQLLVPETARRDHPDVAAGVGPLGARPLGAGPQGAGPLGAGPLGGPPDDAQ